LQILEDTGILVFISICTRQILEDSGKYWLYQYCSYWKILENTGYTSIADTGRLAMKLRNVFLYSLCFFCPVCASDQYLLVLQILEDTGILVFISICTSIADTGRFW
jgi:hypothetical protein